MSLRLLTFKVSRGDDCDTAKVAPTTRTEELPCRATLEASDREGLRNISGRNVPLNEHEHRESVDLSLKCIVQTRMEVESGFRLAGMPLAATQSSFK